jgi:hypothetical protein
VLSLTPLIRVCYGSKFDSLLSTVLKDQEIEERVAIEISEQTEIDASMLNGLRDPFR